MSFSVQIFAFCKKGEAPEAEVGRYIKLLRPYAEVTCMCLKSPGGSFANKNELMDAEAKIAMARIPGKSCLVALSEEGKGPGSSHSFAHWLSLKQQQSRPLVFVVGGAFGIAGSLKQAAHEVVSLSPLTLSHGLAQLVLLEQIYRAFTILKGHPYHK
jgi:23S rRNA (pseudouridine1915-N3)-methyltransferase